MDYIKWLTVNLAQPSDGFGKNPSFLVTHAIDLCHRSTRVKSREALVILKPASHARCSVPSTPTVEVTDTSVDHRRPPSYTKAL